jgi:glutaredoxin
MKKLLLLLIVALFVPFLSVSAADKDLEVYIFTSTGCQYCAQMLSHLDELKETTYPNLKVNEFDLRADPSNYDTFRNYQRAYSTTADGVPVTFIGNKVIKGNLPNEVDVALAECNENECLNPETIVEDYIKANPTSEQTASKEKSLMGWIVIGVVVVGGVVLLLSRK